MSPINCYTCTITYPYTTELNIIIHDSVLEIMWVLCNPFNEE